MIVESLLLLHPKLSQGEKSYCQLEKKVLSLVPGVEKFYQYLYGHKITLITDHKPLLAILGPKKGTFPWLLLDSNAGLHILLSAYSYDI